jgi:hypothetical protein
MKYENIAQRVLFGKIVLAALMSGRKYDVISQNGVCSKKVVCLLRIFKTKSIIKLQRRYRTQRGQVPPSDNAIRRWLKQFQETACVVAAIETVNTANAWRTLGRKLNTAWTSCVP